MIRFALTFLGLVAVFLTLGATAAGEDWLHAPLSRGVAALAHAALAFAGNATRSGNSLGFDGFRALVVEACNGFLPTAIYVAAVLAFPCPMRARVWGVLLGVPAIQAINVLRVVTLMVLGAHWPAAFERMHIYFWQTLVITCTMAVWMTWVETFAGRDETHRACG